MLRFRSISPCLVTAALCLLLTPFAAAANEPGWLEIHSTHFTVITDAGDKKGREVALRFEQMRAVFATLLTKERFNQPIPLTIFAFANDKSYYQLAPLRQGQPIDVPGFFLSGEDQDFFVLNLSEAEPWRAVAHDFAQMLLDYNYPPAQGWFDEGIAEYFSSIRIDNKQVELGGDPELRPSSGQAMVGNHGSTPSPKSFTELLASQPWLSIPDLFAMRPDNSTTSAAQGHALYYAQSWIVMHYLLHERKLPETGTYFGLVLIEHVPVEEAIQKAFGMTSAQLDQAVKDYVHAQSALLATTGATGQTHANPASPANSANFGLTNRFPVPVGPDDSPITSKPLPEADARALYLGVATRIPERRDNAVKELQALASTPTLADKKFESKKEEKRPTEDPDLLPTNAIGNPIAHRVLAWDHIQHGEFEAAATELGDVAALNQRDMWIRYYLSVLKYRIAEAKHTDIQGLSNMMLDLKAVLEWYPELADAYDLLAVARNAGGGPAAAMQAERTAMRLSPRDERYTFHMAQIYVASKKWDAAQVLLERLKASSNPQIAAGAGQLIEQAGTQRKYGVVGSASPQPKLAPQKSPFDVLAEDAAKREAAETSAQSDGPGDKRPTKFLKGRLLGVDCSQAPAAILTVRGDGAALKLRAADYKSLVLIGADDFSCTWQDRQVTVNYKPGGRTDGDVVSLEVR